MVQYSHNQLIFVKRDILLLSVCDVMLDAPEDEGLERSVTGIVRLEKNLRHLALHTNKVPALMRELKTVRDLSSFCCSRFMFSSITSSSVLFAGSVPSAT